MTAECCLKGPILLVSAVPQELADAPRDGCSCGLRRLSAGMGGRASEAVRKRLARERFSLVVSTGFSGGARPGFQVGDLVMASDVISADSGRRMMPAAGYYGLNGVWSIGTFVTVERPLRDPAAKREMGSRYGAIAVDMETAGVAREAEKAGVPWVALRAILDPMETTLAAGSAAHFLSSFVRPGRWKEINDFCSAIRRASKSLGGGIELLIHRVSNPANV